MLCAAVVPSRRFGRTASLFDVFSMLRAAVISPQDFRDFFDAEEEEAARKAHPKAYTYLGNLREEGKAKYVFDRTSHPRGGSLAAHLR